ncbi:MAG: acyltransferase [Pseudomonadota bacterium]
MLKNLQALRAVAALMVVFHHAYSSEDFTRPLPVGDVFMASGVDIFFILSGFVMVLSTWSSDRGPLQFWEARIVRIAPVYWIATLGFVVLFAIGMRPAGLMALDLSDVVTSLFFIPDVRADGSQKPIIMLGWTLNYEMFFYLLFGAVLALGSRVRGLIGVAVLLGLLAMIGLAARPENFYLAFYTNPILLEFVFGTGLGWLYMRHRPNPGALGGYVGVGLLVAGFGALALSEARGFMLDDVAQERWRFLVYGVPAAAIVWGAVLMERRGWAAAAGWVQLLGAASYAIYLFHMYVLQPVDRVAQRVVPFDGDAAQFLIVAAMVAASAVAGVLVHLFIEKPVTRLIKSLRSGRTAGAAAV